MVVDCLDFTNFGQQLRIGWVLCKCRNGNEYNQEDNVKKLRGHAGLLGRSWWSGVLYQRFSVSHSIVLCRLVLTTRLLQFAREPQGCSSSLAMRRPVPRVPPMIDRPYSVGRLVLAFLFRGLAQL